MDKIGLVTITYNSAAVLNPYLDCVLLQTHSNLVCYVVDNASSDETHQILASAIDDRLVVLKNERK